MSAVFSMETLEVTSKFHRNLNVISPNFYSTLENSTLFLFNNKNEVIYKYELPEDRVFYEIERWKKRLQYCSLDYTKSYQKSTEVFIDKEGNIVKDIFCQQPHFTFDDGSYVFIKDGKKGVKNAEGKILIHPKYEYIKSWNNGRYFATIAKEERSVKRFYGIIDHQENILVPFVYDNMITYSFGLSATKDKCKHIFLDNDLKNVYEKEFDQLRIFSSGLIVGTIGDEKYFDFVLDENKHDLKSNIEIAKGIQKELAYIKYKDGRHVLLNKKGNEVFSSTAEKVEFKHAIKDLVEVELDGKTGLMNEKGEWIIEPGKYKYSFKVGKFLDGIFKTDLQNRTTDLINSQGALLFSNVTIGHVTPTKHNFVLSQNRKSGVVSPQGKLLIPFGDYKIREQHKAPGYYVLKHQGKTYFVKLK